MDSLLNGFSTLIIFLLMLGLLVLVHELGHFWTARRLGIAVEEFGIGFPPRAITLFERNGVKYTLNWLPIGGFVRFGGEGEQVYGVGSLAAAAPWKKILVLLAGPLMNLFLTIVIFTSLFVYYGAPVPRDGALIGQVYPNTPAATAGIQSGDVLLTIDGITIGQNATQIQQIARNNAGKTVPITLLRDGTEQTVQFTAGPWVSPQGQQMDAGFGVSYGQNASIEQVGIIRSIGMGTQTTWTTLVAFVDGLGQLVGSLFGVTNAPAGGVTGVVGIARGTGEVIEQAGAEGFWRWTALISLNLFLVNLLPIPALDGSHILFSLMEIARRGKKIPQEKEAMVHAIGFMMLMGLMVIITISDITTWVRGGSVLGQ